jgi:hypothetical protein
VQADVGGETTDASQGETTQSADETTGTPLIEYHSTPLDPVSGNFVGIFSEDDGNSPSDSKLWHGTSAVAGLSLVEEVEVLSDGSETVLDSWHEIAVEYNTTKEVWSPANSSGAEIVPVLLELHNVNGTTYTGLESEFGADVVKFDGPGGISVPVTFDYKYDNLGEFVLFSRWRENDLDDPGDPDNAGSFTTDKTYNNHFYESLGYAGVASTNTSATGISVYGDCPQSLIGMNEDNAYGYWTKSFNEYTDNTWSTSTGDVDDSGDVMTIMVNNDNDKVMGILWETDGMDGSNVIQTITPRGFIVGKIDNTGAAPSFLSFNMFNQLSHDGEWSGGSPVFNRISNPALTAQLFGSENQGLGFFGGGASGTAEALGDADSYKFGIVGGAGLNLAASSSATTASSLEPATITYNDVYAAGLAFDFSVGSGTKVPIAGMVLNNNAAGAIDRFIFDKSAGTVVGNITCAQSGDGLTALGAADYGGGGTPTSAYMFADSWISVANTMEGFAVGQQINDYTDTVWAPGYKMAFGRWEIDNSSVDTAGVAHQYSYFVAGNNQAHTVSGGDYELWKGPAFVSKRSGSGPGEYYTSNSGNTTIVFDGTAGTFKGDILIPERLYEEGRIISFTGTFDSSGSTGVTSLNYDSSSNPNFKEINFSFMAGDTADLLGGNFASYFTGSSDGITGVYGAQEESTTTSEIPYAHTDGAFSAGIDDIDNNYDVTWSGEYNVQGRTLNGQNDIFAYTSTPAANTGQTFSFSYYTTDIESTGSYTSVGFGSTVEEVYLGKLDDVAAPGMYYHFKDNDTKMPVDVDITFDNLGDFSFFTLSAVNTPYTAEGWVSGSSETKSYTNYEYKALGYTGAPAYSPSNLVPTSGYALFGDVGFDAPVMSSYYMSVREIGAGSKVTNSMDSAVVGVNYSNSRIIALLNPDLGNSLQPHFFFGNTDSNGGLLMVPTTQNVWGPGGEAWDMKYGGDGIYGRFYGREYQAVGFSGSGQVDAFSTTTQAGDFNVTAAAFKDGLKSSGTNPLSDNFDSGWAVGFDVNYDNPVTPKFYRSLDDGNMKYDGSTAASGLTLVLNDPNGTVHGNLHAAAFNAAGGSDGTDVDVTVGFGTDATYSAFVSPDLFVSLITADTVCPGTFEADGSFLAAIPDMANHPTEDLLNKSFITMGMWSVRYTDGSSDKHAIDKRFSFFVAGVKDDLTTDFAAMKTNSVTGTYSGPAMAAYVAGSTMDQLSGSSNFSVNFASETFTGTINVSGAQTHQLAASGSISAHGLQGTIDAGSWTIDGGAPVNIVNSGVNASFYGTHPDTSTASPAIGGEFHATHTDSGGGVIQGVFAGVK